jgi:hypothetical protein
VEFTLQEDDETDALESQRLYLKLVGRL